MKNILIVGGLFGENARSSGVVNKLAYEFDNATVYNGGSIEDLKEAAKEVSSSDLVFWMPDISNEVEEIPIFKKIGSVLIVSKVLREHRTRIDAVTRIFKYGGNGVIAINKNGDKFNFTLIDALDNDWANTTDIAELAQGVNSLYEWTKESKRSGTIKMANPIDKFIELNKRVQVESAKQNIRYFGNLSTRCTKMFPSLRTENESCLVSARNTDKSSLNSSDMVQVTMNNNRLSYFGDRKPSVDTPVQYELYRLLPNVNYFIHGHAFIKDAPTTEHYYPCGDLREVEDIVKIIEKSGNDSFGVINLKNHGFLIYSDSLEVLDKIIDTLEFEVKEL